MTGMELLKHMDLIDEELLEKHARAPKRKRPAVMLSLAAACLAVLLCLAALLPGKTPPTVNTLEEPEQILGPSRLGQIGSLDSMVGASAPPEFALHFYSHVITAKVLESLPNTYYLPELRLDSNPTPYRLLRLQVLDVVAGTGLPEELWYLLPERIFVDMTGYDTLVISLWQAGFDAVTLENSTAGKLETFDLLFYSGNHPELGDIIAFSGGVFDESLWQEESWYYGYQFGKFYLDYPEQSYGNMVVSRGSTLEQTLDEIRSRIDEYDRYQEPRVETLDFRTEGARQALEAVRDPENGVYVQVKNGNNVIFYRYAGGIRTNESVTVNLETEAVTVSSAAFTRKELAAMPDVPGYLEQLQAAEEAPPPPHMDPAGKTLRSYGAYGQYVKTDTGVYGVITEVWTYWENREGETWNTGYYDVRYTLLDTRSGEGRQLTARELNGLLGEAQFYDDDCGKGFPLPS